MIRKFNYTGRKKIERKNISIRLIKDKTPVPYFDIALDINSDDFENDPELYVEAYDRSSFMRFRCGTLKQLQIPEDRHLYDIHSTDAILFRVKLVDPSAHHGKILAAADRLASTGESPEETKRISLLPVTYEDLKQEVWKLDFRNTGPVLVVNKNIEKVNIAEIVKTSDLFFGLVYPSVLREILTHVLLIDEAFEDDDPESWQNLWLSFVENLPDVTKITETPEFENRTLTPDREYFLKWIDDEAVPAFCRKFGIKAKFESEIGGDA
jgi:hypothetical protein